METTQLETSSPTVDTAIARRTGWAFIGAFLAFVTFVATIVIGDSDRQTAMADAAEERDLNINDLPADVLIPLLREHLTPLPVVVLLLLLSVVSAGCLIAALRSAGQLADSSHRGRVRLAVLLAWLAAPTFPALVISETVIARTDVGSGFSDVYVALQVPAANYWAGGLAAVALILVTLSLRAGGIVPRMSRVVLALSGLILAASLFGGTPPIAPLLCGMLLGIALMRTGKQHSA